MLHELLSALLGHTGGIFVRGERQVKVLQVPFLHPTELGLLSRLCETATHYCNFRDFLLEYARQPHAGDAAAVAGPVSAGGFYTRALCTALEQVLEPYMQTILKLEHDLLDSPYLSLTHVQYALSEFQLLFPAISSLLDQILHSKARGCQLLEIVHRECSAGDPTVQRSMLRLQMVLHATMYKQLSTWLLHGMLLDTYDEFFIGKERRMTAAEGMAATATVAEAVTPRAEELPAANMHVDSGRPGHSVAGQGLTEPTVSDDSHGRAVYALRIPMLPSYIPVGTAKKILFVGESVLMLESEQRLVGSDLSRATILRDKESEFARAIHHLSEEEVFDIAEFDKIIDQVRSCVAERLWKLVVVDADLAGHLKLMKDFFLLGRGELFQAFIDSAHWILRGPPHMTTEHDVNSVFQQASRSVLFEDEAALRQFSLSISGHASQPGAAAATAALPRAASASSSGSGGGMPAAPQPSSNVAAETGWSALGLHYAVPWPLHVLFTPLALERYNALFKFLLLVRRTQLQLHGCWARQMNRKHRREAPTEDTTRWQLRVHMSFLIDNLQYYLLADVIESQFALLLERTRTCNDFEAVQQAHDGFLTSLLAQSFLLMKPVANCIAEILDTCQSLCALMELVGPDLTADESAQLHAIKKSFQLQSGLLFRLLSSVRSHQIHPHLAQLLLRIDYNRYLSAAGGHLGGKPL